jgi:hypothetical protein
MEGFWLTVSDGSPPKMASDRSIDELRPSAAGARFFDPSLQLEQPHDDLFVEINIDLDIVVVLDSLRPQVFLQLVPLMQMMHPLHRLLQA